MTRTLDFGMCVIPREPQGFLAEAGVALQDLSPRPRVHSAIPIPLLRPREHLKMIVHDVASTRLVGCLSLLGCLLLAGSTPGGSLFLFV